MLFSLLLLLSFQQGSDPLAQATFTMGRGGLRLEPATRAILLADVDGLPVAFTLSYDGERLCLVQDSEEQCIPTAGNAIFLTRREDGKLQLESRATELGPEMIASAELAEAISYRQLDRCVI